MNENLKAEEIKKQAGEMKKIMTSLVDKEDYIAKLNKKISQLRDRPKFMGYPCRVLGIFTVQKKYPPPYFTGQKKYPPPLFHPQKKALPPYFRLQKKYKPPFFNLEKKVQPPFSTCQKCRCPPILTTKKSPGPPLFIK